MGFKPLGEALSETSAGGFRPIEAGRIYAAPLPEDSHAPLDLTAEEMQALPTQLARTFGGPPQPSIADTMRAIIENRTVGLAEAGMNLGTGFAAQIPAGLAGLAAMNPENVHKVAEALTYQPRTAAGERMTAALQYPFEKYEQAADWAGEVARESGATPAQAAGLKTTLMFPPFLRATAPRTAVSTVVRSQEAPAISPIEEWLAKKAEQRAGPVQDVGEVGGVPPGRELTIPPVEPARPRPAEPKPVEYQPYPDLSPAERAIETRTGEYVTGHTDEAIAEYKNRFGNVISTDNARELSPDYLKDRTQSVAVHEPFSALMKEIYRRDLQEPAPEGKENAVVFTAGGTGAGKTHAIYQNGETASLANRAQIVYDTNMNRYDSAKTKIDQALEAGKRAVVLYVYRDPVTALVGQPGIHGVIQRAIGQKEKYGSGRTVPLLEHANTHIGSRDVIERLAKEYEGNPMVSVFALHNKEQGVKPPVSSLTELPRHGYNELYGRLQTALDQEHAAGRVPEEIYRATAREAPRPGARVRAGDAGPGPREPLRPAQREPEAALIGVRAPKRLAEDLPAQAEYLNREAKALGLTDADALLKAKPREFNRLAEEWRNQHELMPADGWQELKEPLGMPRGVGAAQGGAVFVPDEVMVDNLVRAWQNNQIDLKKTQEAIERAGGVITEPANAYLAEELYRDRVTSRIKQAYKNRIEPILKDIKNANLTVDETGKYLWARHAPERNAQMAKINPGESDLSGLSNDEASKILASFPATKREALDRIGERIDTLTASTRQILVKNGLEEPSTIAAWEGAYKHYVPLFRDVDEPGTGRGFQVVGPESKRATGSHKEAQTVLAAVIAQHERAIVRVEKAEVGRALIRLAEEFPNPEFWKVDQPPMKKTVNPTTGLVQTGVDPMYRQRDEVFIVKGKDSSGKVVERVLAFNPKNERAVRLAAAMKNLDVVQLGAVTKAVGKVTRIFANLATSWNPGFWATNFVRDVQTAGVNLQSTPLRGRAPQVFANIPRALGGILSAEFADGKGKWATAYRQFEMEGGKMEWASIFNDLVDRQEELSAQIKASQRGNINPAKWGSLAVDVIEKANSAIENMTRLATFVEGVDRGLSPKQSASLAKNLTVNFRRKGNQSTATGAWYMFFNANVQGTARMIQGLAKSRRAQAIVGTMVAFGAALELVNRMIGEQNLDEEGNNPYELIPEDVKSKQMTFMLKDGKKTSIPLAYGFSVFHNAGRMLMEQVLTSGGSKLVTERKTPLEVAWNFAKVLIDSFMPLGNTTTPAQFIAPTILDPAVQYAENKTWYGGPIRPEPQTFGPATPNHKLYFRDTSDTAKDLTKWLSDITGGDEVQGGSIDISPTTVTHILGSVTGGTGQFGMGMFDFTNHMVNRVAGKETSEDLSWRKVPFVGKFYGEVDDRDKAAKFYRLRSEAMDVWKRMETYRKSGDYDKASQVEEENPALAAMARALVSKSFKKEMSGFRQEFKSVLDLPRDERARERDRLRAEETSTMARAIEAFNAAARESR